MIKSKFAITVHIMTVLAIDPRKWYSSHAIAGSLNINPVLVRQELSKLKAQNLIESKEGRNGGIRLLKPASEIKLSEIFNLVKGKDNILGFSKNKPNPDCPIGKNINNNLSQIYSEMDEIIKTTLEKLTLEEFKNQF